VFTNEKDKKFDNQISNCRLTFPLATDFYVFSYTNLFRKMIYNRGLSDYD